MHVSSMSSPVQRGQETFVIIPRKLFFPTELAQREGTSTFPPSLTFLFKGTAGLADPGKDCTVFFES